MERRVVIFGGTGFIGQYVVRACLAAKFDVTVVVRSSGHDEYLDDLRDRITLVAGDFTVKSEVRRSLTNATDAIVVVGTTVPATAVHDPTHELFATVLPHVNFLDAAVSAAVGRVVVASSGGTVYGNPRTLPIPEDHPLQPITPYGIAKMTIESYCAFYRQHAGLDARVLRIANPYGPGQRVTSGQGFVGTVFARMLREEPITLYGDGRISRDFIHVQDVAHAFVQTLTQASDEWIFNIGSGEGTDLIALLALIEEVTGRTISRNTLPARPFDVYANVLDTTRAKRYLHWQPQIPLREGLRQTWHALRERDHAK